MGVMIPIHNDDCLFFAIADAWRWSSQRQQLHRRHPDLEDDSTDMLAHWIRTLTIQRMRSINGRSWRVNNNTFRARGGGREPDGAERLIEGDNEEDKLLIYIYIYIYIQIYVYIYIYLHIWAGCRITTGGDRIWGFLR